MNDNEPTGEDPNGIVDVAHNDGSRVPPEGCETAVILFTPQVWRNDRAVSGSPLRFELPIEDVVDENGFLPEDNSHESDLLREHKNAPPKAKKWQGPFYVVIDELK